MTRHDDLQFVIIVLCKDPVVLRVEAQLLLGSVESQEDTQAALAILHHAQLLLDGCSVHTENKGASQTGVAETERVKNKY